MVCGRRNGMRAGARMETMSGVEHKTYTLPGLRRCGDRDLMTRILHAILLPRVNFLKQLTKKRTVELQRSSLGEW